MRILLLGHGKWACTTLRALCERGHDVIGVVTETDEFETRRAKDNVRFEQFGAYELLARTASELGLPVHQPDRFHDPKMLATIDVLAPELVVCVSYHTILRSEFLSHYPERVINAHLAPLPEYRGRAPLNWAIINGERETAVTVHFIDEGIDTGPIIVQEPIPIGPDDQAIDVLLRALPVFPKAVCEAVDLLAAGTAPQIPQDPTAGCYFPRRTPEDGLVDWSREPAVDIHNKIRALADPYPGAFSYVGSRKIIFLEARLAKGVARLSPVGGVVYRLPSDGAASVTTMDGAVDLLRVRIEDNEGPADRLLRLGQRLSAFRLVKRR